MKDDFVNKALTRDEDTIRSMFSNEAPHYDFMNHFLSFNTDKGWRRALADKSRYSEYGESVRVLDLCTGTGDVIFEFLRRPDFKGTAVGMDFARPMLDIANQKASERKISDRVNFVEGNALQTGFENESFHLVTIAFGIRNLSDLDKGLHEMYRVLKPGGKFLSLEFFKPENNLSRKISSWYLSFIIPMIGRIVSGRHGAYNYLPASMEHFVSAVEFDKKLLEAGFKDVDHTHFLFRIATLHVARKV